jgi:protein-tyrosine-phosphatase
MRPDLQVESAGLHVAIPISEQVREYLAKQNAEQYLKRIPQSISEKKLRDYDLIVGMEQKHGNAVASICQECNSRIRVWNIEDPYFLENEDAEKVYEKIKEKVAELAKSL